MPFHLNNIACEETDTNHRPAHQPRKAGIKGVNNDRDRDPLAPHWRDLINANNALRI